MFFFENSEIVKRLKKYPVLERFSEFTLGRLVDQSEMIKLTANQMLFQCNESSDSVYYLMDGHLECFSSNSLITKVASIRSGEIVGEMGVFADEPRGMAVKATRECQLLKISREVFLKFFQKDPELLMLSTQTMAKRLRHMIMGLQESHYSYKNIGLICMSSRVSIENLKAVFHEQAPQDNVCIYDKDVFEKSEMEIVPFFYECEDNPSANIFFSVNNDDSWNQAVLDHVDYIYLIVEENAFDTMDVLVLTKIRQRPCDIVILHTEKGPYHNTAKFYARYPFKRHHHIVDSVQAYQRLYRYATGQAIGLVISGGGFRGFAHHGLIKALFDAKIPVDYIGGSSMGAGIGALLALNFDWKHFDQLFHETMRTLKKHSRWGHLTLPIFSILSGEIATKLLMKIFGQSQIEDLDINFFCVVSNLSKSQKEIKKRGTLWEWLRASLSLPGIFPPFEKDGVVYVDGAVCTNLPVLDMREELDDAGKIITFDLRIPPFYNNLYKFPPIWKIKDALGYKLGLSKYRQCVLPGLLDVVMESSLLNQCIYDMQGAKKADIIVSPDTSAMSFKDPKKSESLSLLAYDLAREKLREKKAIYERWVVQV